MAQSTAATHANHTGSVLAPLLRPKRMIDHVTMPSCAMICTTYSIMKCSLRNVWKSSRCTGEGISRQTDGAFPAQTF